MNGIEWLQIPALIGGGMLGVYSTLNVVDRIYRFFVERRLKHFEKIVGYLEAVKKSDDPEYPLYAEGLRQELFMQAFGIRKPRRFREELIGLTASGAINLADISDLAGSGSLKFENGRLIATPNRWLLTFGIFTVVLMGIIVLPPILGADATRHPFGALILFASGALAGIGLGLIGRTTIRPYYLAKRIKKMLEKHYEGVSGDVHKA